MLMHRKNQIIPCLPGSIENELFNPILQIGGFI